MQVSPGHFFPPPHSLFYRFSIEVLTKLHCFIFVVVDKEVSDKEKAKVERNVKKLEQTQEKHDKLLEQTVARMQEIYPEAHPLDAAPSFYDAA